MCNVEKWNQQEAARFQQQFRSGLVLTAKNAAKNAAQFSLADKIASLGSIMIFSAGCNEDNEDCCDEVCDWWNTENDSVAGHTFTISTKTQIDTITSLFMITAGKYFLLVQLKNIWEQLRKYFGWIVWSVNNFGETCFSFCQLQLVQSLTWFLLTTNCQLWKIFILISIITRQCKTMQDSIGWFD